MNRTLVIVPTVNERDNLPRMAEKLLSLPVNVDLLVVDGNSSDGTGAIADELAAKHPQIHVLHEEKKSGLGRAYVAGFKWALQRSYEFIFEMDCDFSHDPDEIPHFLQAAQNADLVLGSRYSGGVRILNWPLKRLLLSRCAGIYVWGVTGMPFTDPTGGYKCFRRRALEAVNLDEINSNGYSFQIEMTHRLWRDGFKIIEVPITFTERVEGSSKLSRRIVVEAFWIVWWLWLQNGVRRWPRKSRQE
ncbi:MAG TPA: polyprenol monophosphomannose synthase [Verrucomicrobiae bacterium]|nr:polyprenol monophosphomannose synthase [Verrucomicrobiae bacterium]